MSLKGFHLFLLFVYLSTYFVGDSFTTRHLYFVFAVICSSIPESTALTVRSFMSLKASYWLIGFLKKADAIHSLKLRMCGIVFPNCNLLAVTVYRQNKICF